MTDRKVEFGYNPPSGTPGVEQFPLETFVRDLQNALEIAQPALLFILGLGPSDDRGTISDGGLDPARVDRRPLPSPDGGDHRPGEVVPTTVTHG